MKQNANNFWKQGDDALTNRHSRKLKTPMGVPLPTTTHTSYKQPRMQGQQSLTGRRVSPRLLNDDGDDASMMIAMLS